jgi:hydrogenase maturation protein HypF
MVRDSFAADQLALLDGVEHKVLADASNPIVVAALRTPSPLASEVTANLNSIGLMLPSTPLHECLARSTGQPLVVTSGNLEGQPLVFDVATAIQELPQTADLCLHHDRPILRPIDDSVVRVIAGRPTTVRLARGLAPLPLALDSDLPILALGGHQKAAIALSSGVQAVLGPHVGETVPSCVPREARDRLLR